MRDRRVQSQIISTVLLSGIILSIVTATFIWGQPLVQKTTDKIKIDTLIDDLTIISDNIDHTQQTGSPSSINLNIQDATYHISETENAIIVKTKTLIPVITSYTFVPVSYTELAFETKLTDINTSWENTTEVSLPDGFTDGGLIQFGNTTLDGIIYNVTVFNTSNTVFDHVCIYEGVDVASLDDDCAEELDDIIKGATTYSISWINDYGTEVILSGGLEENIGTLGTDPGGVISGKSQPVSSEQHVTLKLSYRGLKDATGRIYKTHIQCASGCRAGNGLKKLRIERESVDRSTNQTDYYIKVYFE